MRAARPTGMHAGRLEAFSDGVIAVIITIMVLELKIPHGDDLGALAPSSPVFIAYVLSFILVGIYWNNHHHMLHATERIDGRAMWANLHLLFWLSLVPFATAWVGQNAAAKVPTALYGFIMFMAAIAYTMLQSAIVRCNGANSLVARATRDDRKGKISIAFCVLGIAAGFYAPWISDALYGAVAAIWFVPDRRIERAEVATPS